MVSAVRRGKSLREAAIMFNTSKTTVERWVAHAARQRLDRVDWSDKPAGPKSPRNRTSAEVERHILDARKQLKEESALGEHGAAAIQRHFRERLDENVPPIRTINHVLKRHGQFDGFRRVRRTPPPPAWYLRRVADGKAELDSFDIVEGLMLEGKRDVEVLNAISLHGSLVEFWPKERITAKTTVECMLKHWHRFGMPDYAQFDNDAIFQGPRHPDALGRVIRVCLSLGVTPVFAPPQENGFQANIESYNARWQMGVWRRFHFENRHRLRLQSDRYVSAVRDKFAIKIASAPNRWTIPDGWSMNYQTPVEGKIIFIRRTSQKGKVHLLGRDFVASIHWVGRLVRAEVDLNKHKIDFYQLRRREHNYQPLLNTIEYHFPNKTFKE
jgi:hypothetical protein